MIKIVIVEDNPEHQSYFRIIIDSDPGLSCIAVYDNGEDAIEGIIRHHPDVVLMDVGLPNCSGIECVRILRDKVPATKFIMCTVFENYTTIRESFKAGAHAFMLKTSKVYQLKEAIYAVMKNDIPICSKESGELTRYTAALQHKDHHPIQQQSYII